MSTRQASWAAGNYRFLKGHQEFEEHEAEVALFSDGPFRESLEQLKVRVHLLSLGKVGEIRKEGSFASALSGVPALLRLRKDLGALANGFDVVYANSQKAFLLGALARKGNQKLIWHLRDMLTADHFSPFMRKAAVMAGNKSASTVIVNSKATLESFVQAGGRRSKAVVVYNGISEEPFNTIADSDVEKLRKEIGVEGKFVLGVFGRLSPWKGQDVVIDALAQLPDAHVVIVGEALFGEQAYADGLRTRARMKGAEDRVHFLRISQRYSCFDESSRCGGSFIDGPGAVWPRDCGSHVSGAAGDCNASRRSAGDYHGWGKWAVGHRRGQRTNLRPQSCAS